MRIERRQWVVGTVVGIVLLTFGSIVFRTGDDPVPPGAVSRSVPGSVDKAVDSSAGVIGPGPASATRTPDPTIGPVSSTSASPSAGPSTTRPAASRAPASSSPPASAPPALPAPAPSAVRAKKGVSAWSFPGVTKALGDVGASWYYTWGAAPGDVVGPAGVRFVPMVWGAGSVNQSTLDKVRAHGDTLLAFNEPDLREQANMTVAQALELWPRLQETGMRLGSPAPAYGAATPGSWFDQFMSGAASRGYRVDFIALHWYGSDFGPNAVEHLRSYLQATYERYRKPIWLTEYALINFTGSPTYPTAEQQAAFARNSVAMLESLSYVERYAWFALPATDGSGTGLVRPDGTLTAAGAAYRAA